MYIASYRRSTVKNPLGVLDRFLEEDRFHGPHPRVRDRAAKLKQEVSLVRLVEVKGIELKRHEADPLGLCPFHPDRDATKPIGRLLLCGGAISWRIASISPAIA